MRDGVLKQITDLERLTHAQLKERGGDLYGTEPSASNRALLIKRLAYRIQELAFGGVSDTTRVKLRDHIDNDRLDTDAARDARLKRRRRQDGMPVRGTRLIREWRGKRYEVTVVDGGFEFAGCRYRSLTAVTKVITGTHWNGPAFFGLRKPAKGRSSS